jgi:hypothetical protein
LALDRKSILVLESKLMISPLDGNF